MQAAPLQHLALLQAHNQALCFAWLPLGWTGPAQWVGAPVGLPGPVLAPQQVPVTLNTAVPHRTVSPAVSVRHTQPCSCPGNCLPGPADARVRRGTV